ncbi:hypothetical protein GA0074696_0274 [Micromonospora purpureochromogenes]|uniref:Uncharacterized protein n=1 Tax=Micromonospora purpureochromogenes TaxID=47872 RepID=A0A1C4UCM8_9ACTN|nr:hypothetical protein [Micromonospora purpureochromogenes]SCE69411.1 hypothetical protein GA0074696_0274 [Micromonospora purpureochromogenes]
MSEYQYYEFVAVDRPLTSVQQRELRALSTRARITSSSFVNDYQWGDLKGDPREWMQRYFDAFLYLANWGTHRVALRLPVAVLDPGTAAEYCVGKSACSWATRTHVILDLHSEDEDGDEEYDGGGHLAAILPARAELAVGDRRLLYLAWLLCVQNRELADDEPEPPVPPGLGDLSGPQRALVDFLRLDPDLLDVAAEASTPLKKQTPSAATLLRWVKTLPEPEKNDLVVRLMRGDDSHLRSELLARFHGPASNESTGAGRTAGELLAAADERWSRRQQLAQQREAAERERRERAAAAAREQRLNALAGRQEQEWQRVAVMIETKRRKEYDAAIVLLCDLKALADRDGDAEAFRQRVLQLRERHARKPSLLDRLDRARLG